MKHNLRFNQFLYPPDEEYLASPTRPNASPIQCKDSSQSQQDVANRRPKNIHNIYGEYIANVGRQLHGPPWLWKSIKLLQQGESKTRVLNILLPFISIQLVPLNLEIFPCLS